MLTNKKPPLKWMQCKHVALCKHLQNDIATVCVQPRTDTRRHMQKQPVSFRSCKHQLLAQLQCSLRHQSQGASSPHCWLLKFVFGSPTSNVFFIMIVMSASTLSLKSPIQERACHEAKHLIPAQALRVVVREKVALRLNLDQIIGALRWAANLVHKDSANTSAYQPCMGSVLVILVTVLHVPCKSCASFASGWWA